MKSGRLQIYSFVRPSRADSSHVEINWGVRGTYFYFQITKTSCIHKVRFLGTFLAVIHVVNRQEITLEAQESRAAFDCLPPLSWTNM